MKIDVSRLIRIASHVVVVLPVIVVALKPLIAEVKDGSSAKPKTC